jgi:hypothetical protein
MEEQAKSQIQPGQEPLVQTTVLRRKLKMLLLLKQEVDRLVAGYSSPCLGLFGLFCGAFLALLIADIVAGLVEPTKRYFVDATIITGAGMVIFLWFAGREWWNARKVVADLEKEKGLEFDVATKLSTTERE